MSLLAKKGDMKKPSVIPNLLASVGFMLSLWLFALPVQPAAAEVFYDRVTPWYGTVTINNSDALVSPGFYYGDVTQVNIRKITYTSTPDMSLPEGKTAIQGTISSKRLVTTTLPDGTNCTEVTYEVANFDKVIAGVFHISDRDSYGLPQVELPGIYVADPYVQGQGQQSGCGMSGSYEVTYDVGPYPIGGYDQSEEPGHYVNTNISVYNSQHFEELIDLRTAQCFAALSGTCTNPSPSPSPTPTAPSFADVPGGYWAHDQIGLFAARGITTGCGDDAQCRRLYCPERGVTRAEMATFITRTLGQDKAASPTTPTFADVPTDYWAYGQIEAFATLGITTGCGLNERGQRLFCPDRGVTRAEMAVFLDRAKGQTELPAGSPTFADVPTGYWAYGFIERFFTLGVTTGCGTDDQGRKVYCPDRGVTRAEMAVFIIRAYP